MMDPTSADNAAPDEPDDSSKEKKRAQQQVPDEDHKHEDTITINSEDKNTALPARPVVHYRSTALEEMGMVTNRDVHAVPAVIAAAATAERIREEYKRKTKLQRSTNGDDDDMDLGVNVGEGGVSKAVRYDRRTKLNRDSAAASRLRKEAYIAALEQQLLLEHKKNTSLKGHLKDERTAHNKLKTQFTAATVNINEEEEQAVDTPIDPAIVQQIFFHQPNFPPADMDGLVSPSKLRVPSTEVEMNMDMGAAPISNLSNLHIAPEDIMQLDLPFAPIPSQFLDNTSPADPHLLIDEMLDHYNSPNHDL